LRRLIAAGPDGAMWFTEGAVGKIGRIAPEGRIREFRFGSFNTADAITAGPDGNVWFAERFAGRIGIVTPEGDVTFLLAPRNTLEDIAFGPDGNLWVTEFAYDRVARITPEGVGTESQVLEGTTLSAITAGPGRTVWFLGYFSSTVYRLSVP
jgi:virginiamycin B lyase